eukprot:4804266-Pyramimonas_sp.AAC.2
MANSLKVGPLRDPPAKLSSDPVLDSFRALSSQWDHYTFGSLEPETGKTLNCQKNTGDTNQVSNARHHHSDIVSTTPKRALVVPRLRGLRGRAQASQDGIHCESPEKTR